MLKQEERPGKIGLRRLWLKFKTAAVKKAFSFSLPLI